MSHNDDIWRPNRLHWGILILCTGKWRWIKKKYTFIKEKIIFCIYLKMKITLTKLVDDYSRDIDVK